MEYFHLTTPQQNIWNLQKYYRGTAIANLCGAVFFQERRDSKLLPESVNAVKNIMGIGMMLGSKGHQRKNCVNCV